MRRLGEILKTPEAWAAAIINGDDGWTQQKFSAEYPVEQMAAWAQFLKGQGEHPFPYEKARTSMLLTFAVLQSIQEGRSLDLVAAQP